jgi:hypothetical protein
MAGDIEAARRRLNAIPWWHPIRRQNAAREYRRAMYAALFDAAFRATGQRRPNAPVEGTRPRDCPHARTRMDDEVVGEGMNRRLSRRSVCQDCGAVTAVW